jgi:hypothetical protein
MAWFYSALMAWNWTVVDSSMGLRVILPACPPGAASGDGASHSINRMVRLAYLRQAARTKVTTDAIAPDVAKNSLIQIRLKADTRPFARADRGDACGICNEPVPGGFAGFHDFVLAVPNQCTEFVLP